MRLKAASWTGLIALLVLGACSDGPVGPAPPYQDAGTDGRWLLEYGRLNVRTFESVWASGPGDIWAGGGQGYLGHFDGEQWVLIDPWDRGPVRVDALWGFARDDIWAVGFDTVAHYDGLAWEVLVVSIDRDLFGLWGMAPDDIWAVGSGGIILHYDGDAWTTHTTWNGYQSLYAVAGLDADTVFAVGEDGLVLRWDGEHWSQMSSPTEETLYGVHADAAGRMVAVGGDGDVIRWSGSGWEDVYTGSSHDLFGVTSLGDRTYAVGRYGEILVEEEGTWSSQSSGGDSRLKAVARLDATSLVAVGQGGAVLIGDGEAWTRLFPEVGGTFRAIWSGEAGLAWAVGDDGAICRRADGVWTAGELGERDFHGVWGRSADAVWAVGEDGEIRRHDGAAWSAPLDAGTSADLFAVHGNDAGAVWAVGAGGRALRREAEGWATLATGVGVDLLDCWVGADGRVIAVGEEGRALRWDPAAEAWSELPGAGDADLRGVVGFPGGGFAACAEDGRVLLFAGEAWSELPASEHALLDLWGTSPDALWVLEAEGRLLRYAGGDGSVAADVALGSLLAVHGNAQGGMLAAGEYGRILRYTP